MIALRILTVFLAALMISCSEYDRKVIHYEYNGVTVTRINDYPKDTFYYGRHNAESEALPNSYVASAFSGFDGGMGAYLIFKENKQVEVLRVYAIFDKVGTDSLIVLRNEMGNVEFINWRDSVESNMGNVVYVSDILWQEKERNLKGKSKVHADYNIK